MASYVVLTPPGRPSGDERSLFIRDGFNWLALIFPIIWMLRHRLWLWALATFALYLVIGLVIGSENWSGAGIALSIGVTLLIGLEAQHIRIHARERQGWKQAAAIEAPDRGSAEEIFFRAALTGEATPAGESARSGRQPAPRRPDNRNGPALGLFDYPGNR